MERISTFGEPLGFSDRGLQEYSLVVQPPEEINAMIRREKKYFHGEYKEKAVTTSPITIASFIAREEMEETLIRYMHRICSELTSFSVTLNNFSSFPSHTIYLRVQEEPFKELGQRIILIDPYIQSSDCPPIKIIAKPYLVIARCLSEENYLKAIVDYSQRTFYASFLLKELLLIRRNRQRDDCKSVSVFKFLPPHTILFN